jgi:hypothetical protein
VVRVDKGTRAFAVMKNKVSLVHRCVSLLCYSRPAARSAARCSGVRRGLVTPGGYSDPSGLGQVHHSLYHFSASGSKGMCLLCGNYAHHLGFVITTTYPSCLVCAISFLGCGLYGMLHTYILCTSSSMSSRDGGGEKSNSNCAIRGQKNVAVQAISRRQFR